MPIVTDYLAKKSSGLVSTMPEVRDEGRGYMMYDSGGVEAEVGELIYGFIRALKPKSILTTGIYTGISDMYIALGLSENRYGHIDAIEYEYQHIERAKRLWQTVGVSDRISAHHTSSLDFQPTKQYQFMFLDTELHLRFHELVKFYPYLDPGGYVFIHDMPVSLCQNNVNPDHPDFKHWPVGEIPVEVKNWVKDGELRPMFFPNPRGMLGFYRSRSDEYKWL